jgi:hypothetical protein
VKKDVHTTVGPIHSAITVSELSLTADCRLQVIEQRIKPVEVLASGHIVIPEADGFFVSPTKRAIKSPTLTVVRQGTGDGYAMIGSPPNLGV